MIKIYYNPTTGAITQMQSANVLTFSDDPFIEITDKIKIDEWLVDPSTKELIKI